MTDEIKRPSSEARKRANAKYDSKAYDRIILRVEAGKREKIKTHAENYQSEVGEKGKRGHIPKGSVTGFINRAIDEAIKRDKAHTGGMSHFEPENGNRETV